MSVRSRQLTLASLKGYVERHLTSPDLCAATICTQSGWSRATVYRLFKGEGGLLSYVQRRRLQRAFQELAAFGEHRRILDIALECQFASEATFNRAFRRTFGLPPGAARSLLQQASRSSMVRRRGIAQELR
jgi:AraC-like DNA-binding protein